MEEWRPVVDYEGLYEVSSEGRVRSQPRTVLSGGVYRHKKAKFVGCRQPNGYVKVILTDRAGVRSNFHVHVLVLRAFVGPPPPNHNALHGPRGASDNSVSNLSWGTQKQNLADQERDGVLRHGDSHGNRKLTSVQVIEIFKSALRQSTLAAKFGVSVTQISAIKTGKTWRRVTGARR